MNKLKIIVALLIPLSAFAVKGTNIIQNSDIESQSCLIEAKYEGSDEIGVCSSFVVEGNMLLTAKHCVVKNPKKYIEDSVNELQNLDEIRITCNGKKRDGLSLNVHPEIDIAAIEINIELSSQISFATEDEILALQKNPKAYKCASFGYGLNNENKLRSFSGVIIDDLKIYDFEEAEAEIAMDYDFKNMANYFANSMSSQIEFNQYFLPNIFQYETEETFIEVRDLFETFWSEISFNYNSVFDPELGPKVYDDYIHTFKKSYLEVMSEKLTTLKVQKLKKQKPVIIPVLNTSSFSNERAGFDYGDSGGVFACYLDNIWKAVALNSKISDSNRSYSAKPWEPMHSKPKMRITKNGITVPFVNVITDWILEI